MVAAEMNHAGVVRLLIERGADGTKASTKTALEIAVGSTALDIARLHAKRDCLGRNFSETLAVLRLMCCSGCGVTSAGLSAAGLNSSTSQLNLGRVCRRNCMKARSASHKSAQDKPKSGRV
jgi:hypothetical protein